LRALVYLGLFLFLGTLADFHLAWIDNWRFVNGSTFWSSLTIAVAKGSLLIATWILITETFYSAVKMIGSPSKAARRYIVAVFLLSFAISLYLIVFPTKMVNNSREFDGTIGSVLFQISLYIGLVFIALQLKAIEKKFPIR
jgi:hypothetical protein